MDTNDIEEMLFARDVSHEFLEDAASDVSEDEMLDGADDEELILWGLEDSPMLMAVHTDHKVESHIDLTTIGLRSRKEPPAHSLSPPVRGRYCSSPTVC
jgi:hypothetical protein